MTAPARTGSRRCARRAVEVGAGGGAPPSDSQLDAMEGGGKPETEIYTDADGVMRQRTVGFSGVVKLKGWARRSRQKVQARRTATAPGDARAMHLAQLTAFYQAINPKIVEKVPMIFEKECSTEEKRERFWGKLKQKYGRSPAEMDVNNDGIIDDDEIGEMSEWTKQNKPKGGKKKRKTQKKTPPGYSGKKRTQKPQRQGTERGQMDML